VRTAPQNTRGGESVRVAIFKFYLSARPALSFADKILSFAAYEISPSRRANFIFVDG